MKVSVLSLGRRLRRLMLGKNEDDLMILYIWEMGALLLMIAMIDEAFGDFI